MKKVLSCFVVLVILMTVLPIFVTQSNAVMPVDIYMGKVTEKNNDVLTVQIEYKPDYSNPHNWVSYSATSQWTISNSNAINEIRVGDYIEIAGLLGVDNEGESICIGKMKSSTEKVITDVYGDPDYLVPVHTFIEHPGVLNPPLLGDYIITYENIPDCSKYSSGSFACNVEAKYSDVTISKGNEQLQSQRLYPGRSFKYEDKGRGYNIDITFNSGEAPARPDCTDQPCLGPQAFSDFTIHIKKIEEKMPDLIIQDISWNPSNPKEGDTVTFTVTVKNQGSENAKQQFEVVGYVMSTERSDDFLCDFSFTVPSLAAGKEYTSTATCEASRCGKFTVGISVDFWDAVKESNEENNYLEAPLSISCVKEKPDLVIQNISWSPSNPKQGDKMTFTVKIKNQGSGSAGTSYVYYYIDGSYVDSDTVPSLSVGSTSTQTFMWTANKCGDVQVKAWADATDKVDEGSNEWGNTKIETVNVECEKLDLAIIDMTYSPFPCPEMGEDISIELLVKNEGQSRIKGTHSIFINLIDNASISGRMHSFTAMREGEVILDYYNPYIGTLNLDLSPGETQTIDCEKFKISDEGKCILANTLQVKIAPVEYQDSYSANNIINKTFLMNLGSQYRYACVYHAARLAFSTFFPHGCLLDIYMAMLQSNPSLQEHYLNAVEAFQNGDLATAAYEYIQVLRMAQTHQGIDPILFAKNFVEGILETSECIAKTILFLANFQVWFQHLITSFPLQVFDIESPADIIVTNEVGERVGYINGQTINEMANAEVIVNGDKKIVIIYEDGDYNVQLHGTDYGTADYYMLTSSTSKPTKIVGYNNVQIAPTTSATVNTKDYTMSIDYDGDGVMDEEKSPDVSELIEVEEPSVKPKGWLHSGYDLDNARFYPYPSETPVASFDVVWTSPNKGKILTGDINGDGELELVSAFEERVCAMDKNGVLLWSNNVATDSGISGAKVNSMDLADMDGDGAVEIAVGVSPQRSNVKNRMKILFYNGNGALLKTITTVESKHISSVKCADLNNDGSKEVIAGITAGYILKPRGVYIYDYSTGSEIWHYCIGPTPQTLTIADVTGDTSKEIILGTNGPWNGNSANGISDSECAVICLNSDGKKLWMHKFEKTGFVDAQVAVSDLDGDGRKEIIACSQEHGWEKWDGSWGKIYTLNPDTGEVERVCSVGMPLLYWAGMGIANFDGDGHKEIIVAVKEGSMKVGGIMMFDSDLNPLRDYIIPDSRAMVGAVNDIDGDGKKEVIVCTDDKRLVILDNELREIWNYKLGAKGNAIVSDLILGGTNEIIVSADKLYVFSGVPTPMPDLIVSSIHFDPYPAHEGESFVATITVKNQGDGDAGPHWESLESSYAVCTWQCSGLKTGASKTITRNLGEPEYPDTFKAYADWGDKVQESNEDNNCLTAFLDVGENTNKPPVSPTLTPDKSSPQPAGTTIKWTASATDPDGDQLYYMLWMEGPATGNSWHIVKAYSTDNIWTWHAASADVGTNSFCVWIRDGHHALIGEKDLEVVYWDYEITA